MSDRLVHVQRRYASQERNVVKSPFGKVDIPRQSVTEYVFEGYEKYADKPAIVSISSSMFDKRMWSAKKFSRKVSIDESIEQLKLILRGASTLPRGKNTGVQEEWGSYRRSQTSAELEEQPPNNVGSRSFWNY